jgi:hypothetical protein
MASLNQQIQLRLAWYARWLLVLASKLAKYTPIRIPHSWVVAVTNRSWRMRVGSGSRDWIPIRINNRGRVIG